MQKALHTILDSIKKPIFPELIIIFMLLGFMMVMGLPSIYLPIVIVLTMVSLVASYLSIFHPKKYITSALVLIILAITAGILKFNYLPSLALWLLICTRFMLISSKHSISMIITTIAAGLLSLVAANLFLPNINYSLRQQNLLNFWIISGMVIVVSLQFWRLIDIINHYRADILNKQQRVDTLVNTTNKLTRYLPPQIWQPILINNSPVEINNNRRKLTILFSDVVGFTNLSDNISPDHLANILNTYFESMTLITQKYGATLDKFLGDGLLCYFGDTLESNDRDNAIKCASMAIEMRLEMQVLKQQWRLLGFEGLHIRIGINTGYCYVGNFGSRSRMTYTIIGKEANFASRLETAAKKDQILISESTYNLIKHVHNCQIMGEFQFKGLHESAKVWELLDPKQSKHTINNWMDFNLPGFNMHLNVNDMRNYDKQTILKHLNDALELVEQNQPKP